MASGKAHLENIGFFESCPITGNVQFSLEKMWCIYAVSYLVWRHWLKPVRLCHRKWAFMSIVLNDFS